MGAVRNSLPSVVLLGALLLGGVGIALQAADQPEETSPRDVLDPLLEQTEWQANWVEDLQAHRVAFKGPDVWVRLSGDYIVVQSYLGRLPREVAVNDLTRLLRKNYDLYEGKFGLDKDMDLWFEIATSRRLLDSEELNRQIAFVANAAAGAADLVKTETPAVPPQPGEE
jgi:hypothetical protein